jgi:hypothetical protein
MTGYHWARSTFAAGLRLEYLQGESLGKNMTGSLLGDRRTLAHQPRRSGPSPVLSLVSFPAEWPRPHWAVDSAPRWITDKYDGISLGEVDIPLADRRLSRK